MNHLKALANIALGFDDADFDLEGTLREVSELARRGSDYCEDALAAFGDLNEAAGDDRRAVRDVKKALDSSNEYLLDALRLFERIDESIYRRDADDVTKPLYEATDYCYPDAVDALKAVENSMRGGDDVWDSLSELEYNIDEMKKFADDAEHAAMVLSRHAA